MPSPEGTMMPALPFTVLPSGGQSLEVSTSPYKTSSGSFVVAGRPPDGPWPGNSSHMELHAHRWQQFVQQNALVVNIDPAIVEQYVQARLTAERASMETAVSSMRAEAEVAFSAAHARLTSETMASQAGSAVRAQAAELTAVATTAAVTLEARGEILGAQAEAAVRTHRAEAAARVAGTEARLTAEAFEIRSRYERATVQEMVARTEQDARMPVSRKSGSLQRRKKKLPGCATR